MYKHIAIELKDNKYFASNSYKDELRIVKKTFREIESLRVIRFETVQGGEVMIPFESILYIVKEK